MKKLLAVSALLALLVVACATNQIKIAYNSIYTVQVATTAAYDGYIDQVIYKRVPTNGVPHVSRAYNTFQASVLVALQAVRFNTNAVAPASLAVQSQDVLNLINNWKGMK